MHDIVAVCTPDFTEKLPCVLMAPFASATDQMTVSAFGELVVTAMLNAVLFGKMRMPSVVGVSALIKPLAVPPDVCVGEPHEMADVPGVGVVAGGVVAGGVVTGGVVTGGVVTGGVVTGGVVTGGVVTGGVVTGGVVTGGVTGFVAAARLTQHDFP